jgi:tripartite-type tricarboxylate transporter receptor subunit TctC
MALLQSAPLSAWAQSANSSAAYPSKPITLIIPFPAGGSTDSVARAIAQKLTTQLGVPVITENHPGAGGNIGCDIVAKANPDGYTLLISTTSTHSLGAALGKKTPFNYDTDFTPIVHLATAPNIFLVTKQIQVHSLKEFIGYANLHPDSLNYGSSGTGTIMHLTGESFSSQAGVNMMHIPYKGSSLAMPDLISGKIQVIFDSIVSGAQHVEDGKLIAIAVTGKKRSPLMPGVPTLSEIGAPYGLANFVSENWWGLYGPKNLPKNLVDRINSELNTALKSPQVREQFAKLGADAGGGSAKAFTDLVLEDRARWSNIIKVNKITID